MLCELRHSMTGRMRTRVSRNSPRRRPAPRSARRALGIVEQLEEKQLLSTFTVNSLADSGDGTLRWAITQANQNLGDDTINFAVDGTIILETALPALSDTSGSTELSGPGPENLTVARNSEEGTPEFRILTINPSTDVTLTGMTMTGGRLTHDGETGGAISNAGTLRITNTTIDHNHAQLGGGIYTSGPLIVEACTFTWNWAASTSETGQGGAIMIDRATEATISFSSFFANGAQTDGGAIYSESPLTVTDCYFELNGMGLSDEGDFSWEAQRGGNICVTTPDGDLPVSLTVASTFFDAGAARHQGGAIYCEGPLTVEASEFRDAGVAGRRGEVGYGGIIYSAPGTGGEISPVTIRSSYLGGGICGEGFGGGIFIAKNPLTIENCVILGNGVSPAASGGAIYGEDSTIVVTSSIFDENYAVRGAGIYCVNGSVSATSSSFSRGWSESEGTGIYASGSTLTINSCTFGDPLSTTGGTIYVSSTGALVLRNTIVAASSSARAIDVESGGSITGAFNLVEDGSDGLSDTIVADPLLGPLQVHYSGGRFAWAWTHTLLPGSPALDAGDPALASSTDQRGVERPQGAGVDIGAFESSGFTVVVEQGDDQWTSVGTAFTQPLVVRVQANDPSEPVEGGQVTFSSPATGASATFAPVFATIGADGRAQTVATANGVAGTCVVTAGVDPNLVGFTLTNLPSVVEVSARWGSQGVYAFGEGAILPWTGINRFQLRFDQPFTALEAKHLALAGLTRGDYLSGATVSVDSSGQVATIQLAANHVIGSTAWDAVAPRVGDRLRLDFGAFHRNFAALPGDYNRDGIINAADLVGVRNEYLGLALASIFGDLDGDGDTDLGDYTIAHRRAAWRLPPI